MIRDFYNEPGLDFENRTNYEAMAAAIAEEKKSFGKEYYPVIAGEKVGGVNKIASTNPSRIEEVIGYAWAVDTDTADEAIKSAWQAFENWSRVGCGFRARCLLKAAAILRKKRLELAATMVLEAGKNWAEADGDVAEAIDYLEIYAINALELDKRVEPLVRIEGEDNELFYIPLGVGAVIVPWNFPLAILAGMTGASIVTGNTVVVKPASATPVIASKFMEVLLEAGVPDGVVNLIYGSGPEVGSYLVGHPRIRFINFTGSREAGIFIAEEAGKIKPGQIWIKRVSAEMGGKDAIIVDSEADLDAAVEGITSSAFSYQGQKCAACSRAIIDEKVYEEMAQRLVEAAKKLSLGPAEDYKNYMGPVIDRQAYEKVLKYIEIGKKDGKLLVGGEKGDRQGFFIKPTIFGEIKPGSPLDQDEIFGPVLALIRAGSFEEALNIANGTDYGLTGSVYSRNRARLEKARWEFHVGNLYFNRKSTGAIVGVHPFGGYNMSGTCTKAGGRDYLLQFCQGKTVSEKLD